MKRIVVLLLLMSCGSLQAQRKIDGIYMGIPEYKNIPGLYSSEDYIIISKNKFVYMIPQYHCPIRMNDTLAECHYNWVDNEFIEFTCDKSPSDLISAATTVRQVFDSEIHKDSVVMHFIDENRRWIESCVIKIYTNSAVEPYIIEGESNRLHTILLPLNFESFHFEIVPTEMFYDSPHYILMKCKSPVYVKEGGINLIEVTANLENLFEKIHVNKEFAQIKGHTIIWENRKYKKISPRKKILGFGTLKNPGKRDY